MGVERPARGGAAQGRADPRVPGRLGAGGSGVRVCGAGAYRKLVAERYGVVGGRAGAGAVPALDGGMASFGRAGFGTRGGCARTVQSRLGAPGARFV